MMFTCQEQRSSLPFTFNFHYSYYSLGIVVNFLLPLFTYPTAQHKWWTQKEQSVLLATVLIYLPLMQNTFVWLYSMLFRCHRRWQFVCLHCHCALLAASGWGSKRLVAASCVFHRNVMLSSPPSFLICYYYRCLSRHSCMSRAHAHFGQSSNTAIKVFTCLYISIKICVLPFLSSPLLSSPLLLNVVPTTCDFRHS